MQNALRSIVIIGVLSVLAHQAEAQQRQRGQPCPGDSRPVSGTAAGQAQWRQHGRVMPPEFTRTATILAAIENDAQRERLRQSTIQRLRQQGFSTDEIDVFFSLAYQDAVAGVNAARTARGVLGAVTGGVAALSATGDARAVLGGGAAGARGARNLGINLIQDRLDLDIQRVIDIVIPEPCRMSAEQAIQLLSRN